VLAGFPVVDVKVTLTFGSYHDVDSNENAFRWPVRWRSRKHAQGQPGLLEPMMAVEVETPEDYMGNVMGDLSSVAASCRAWTTWLAAARSSSRSAAVGNVRLLDVAAFADARSRHVHDGVQALRRSAANVAEAIISAKSK
jgi:elongation factor G